VPVDVTAVAANTEQSPNDAQMGQIVAQDLQTLLHANALPGNDFEDNIPVAAAIRAALDAIVTRNVADFSYSPLPVWEPAVLLKRLPGGNARRLPVLGR
jgi:hypothetical protein